MSEIGEQIGDLTVVGKVIRHIFEIVPVVDPEGRPLVLKRIPWLLAGNEAYRVQFEAEIDRLMGFDHPHLVNGLSSGSMVDGRRFVVLERAKVNLDERIAQGMLANEAFEHLRRVADALGHLHQRGDCHYDVKPENILLFDDPTGGLHAKLNDFSLTRSVLHDPHSYGEREYAAPEVLWQREVEDHLRPRADVLSFAMVTSKVLLGMPAPLRDRNDPSAAYWQRLPPNAVLVLIRACAMAPEARHQSALQFLDEVLEALGLQMHDTVLPISLPATNEEVHHD